MSLDSVISRARRRQAVQFTQRCTVQRPVGEPTYVDGEYGQEVVTRYTDLPCKVSTPDQQGLEVAAGQTQALLTDSEIKFSADDEIEVARGDLVTITSGKFNTIDVGITYTISHVDRREWQVSRRCFMEETTVPMLWEEES